VHRSIVICGRVKGARRDAPARAQPVGLRCLAHPAGVLGECLDHGDEILRGRDVPRAGQIDRFQRCPEAFELPARLAHPSWPPG
jgi:hypothetical protein